MIKMRTMEVTSGGHKMVDCAERWQKPFNTQKCVGLSYSEEE